MAKPVIIDVLKVVYVDPTTKQAYSCSKALSETRSTVGVSMLRALYFGMKMATFKALPYSTQYWTKAPVWGNVLHPLLAWKSTRSASEIAEKALNNGQTIMKAQAVIYEPDNPEIIDMWLMGLPEAYQEHSVLCKAIRLVDAYGLGNPLLGKQIAEDTRPAPEGFEKFVKEKP